MVWVIWPSKNTFWEHIIGIVMQRVRSLYHISEGAPLVSSKSIAWCSVDSWFAGGRIVEPQTCPPKGTGRVCGDHARSSQPHPFENSSHEVQSVPTWSSA